VSEDRGTVRILVVDDEKAAQRVMLRLLEKQGFEADAVPGAAEARAAVATGRYGLVLTDFDMPLESGLALVQQLASERPNIACVMVTGHGNVNIGKTVIESGAYGYISKPVDPDELWVGVVNALERRRLEILDVAHRRQLEETVKERTADLWEANLHLERALQDVNKSQEETVAKLALAAEFRDDETARHIRRMSHYCGVIASHLGMDQERAARTRLASVMHDVGKIGTPDAILRKPGLLTDEERVVIQQHAEIGHHILSPSDSPLLQLAAEIALTHHEKWDGSGYPNGLSGTEIPIEGRIAAVADVFDAITTDRVYRKAFQIPKAIEIMRESKGSHFDPDVLAAFFKAIPEIIHIRDEYQEAKLGEIEVEQAPGT
jgi:putative two-component system response regulator